MKRCSKCGGQGPFNRDASRPDGFSRWCRECLRRKCKTHYAANAEERKATAAKYREANRSKIREKATAYNKSNKDKIAASMKARRTADPVTAKAIAKRYRQKNHAKILDRIHVRRERIRNNGPVEKINRRTVWERDGGVCQECGDPVAFEAMHLDHVRPVSKGGTHTYDNVRTTCEPCNIRKGSKMPQEVADGPAQLEHRMVKSQ